MSNKWFKAYPPRPDSTIKLICIPYAGGSGSEYQQWHTFLPDWIEIIVMHPPGRGARMPEQPFTDMRKYASAIADNLPAVLDNKPFALYGHSLGGWICRELILELKRRGSRLPELFFCAGSSEPYYVKSRPMRRKPVKDMSYDDFVAYLRALGGTPEEILSNRDIMEAVVLPVMTADLSLIDNYTLEDEPEPFPVPIIMIRGTKDTAVPQESQESWRRHTSDKFIIELLDDDHFFLKRAKSNGLAQILLSRLSQFAPM